jgi:CheY-like chemotaxis protein
MIGKGTILIVDDDENDLQMLERALLEAGVSNPLQLLGNGIEAIDYLKGEGAYGDRQKYPLPCLMLLDLKLPLCDGFQVLAWRQNQENLDDFPVIILSSSSFQKDTQRALGLGATACFEKPVGLECLVTLAKEFKSQWLQSDSGTRPPSISPGTPEVLILFGVWCGDFMQGYAGGIEVAAAALV